MAQQPRRYDFFMIDHEIHDLYAPVIRAVGIAVYGCLVRHAHQHTGSCFPSIRTIAKGAGVSVSTVKRAIDTLSNKDGTLDEAGLPALIQVTPFTRDDGSRGANRYRILPVAKRRTEAGVRGRASQSPPQSSQNPSLGHTEPAPGSVGPSTNKTEENKTKKNKKDDPDGSHSLPSQNNSTEHALINAFCEESGKPDPVARGKALSQAKTLVTAGVTPDEVRGCTQWLMDNKWWQDNGFDFGSVVSNIDKWRGRSQKPQPRPRNTKAVLKDFDPVAFLAEEFLALDEGQLAEMEAGTPLMDVLDETQSKHLRAEMTRRGSLADMMRSAKNFV